MTRYISRVLRPWSGQLSSTPGKGVKKAISGVAGKLKKAVKTPSKAASGKPGTSTPGPVPRRLLTGGGGGIAEAMSRSRFGTLPAAPEAAALQWYIATP